MGIDIAILPVLAGLALADSLSLGALAIPVWLLLAPRLRPARVVAYLVTLGVFYFAVGVLALLGLRPLLTSFEIDVNDARVLLLGLVAGVALLVLSFAMDSKKARQRRAAGESSRRLSRWRARAVGGVDSAGRGQVVAVGTASVIGLAVAAGVAEIATMVPYIAAVGVITTGGVPIPLALTLLGGYCAVMLLPAAVLLLLRLAGGRAVEGILQRIDWWFARHGMSTLSWLIGIVGVILIIHTIRVVMPFAGIGTGIG